jgi:gamma-glutamyl-gamma-aminobutyrate hydrolase PuuD
MEYFLGSLITLLIMAYFSKRSQQVMSKKLKSVRLSQSYIDSLVSQKILDILLPPEKKKTQSNNHFKKNEVRVIVVEGEAYWIVDQTLYVANMVDGAVDNDTTRKVDTMTMDDVQLEKTEFIVQKLTEGKGNDSGYPRKP